MVPDSAPVVTPQMINIPLVITAPAAASTSTRTNAPPIVASATVSTNAPPIVAAPAALPACPSSTFYPLDQAGPRAPMIPAAVFLPFLTCLVLVAGRYIIARQNMTKFDLVEESADYGEEGSGEALAETEEDGGHSRYDLSNSATRETDSIDDAVTPRRTRANNDGVAAPEDDDNGDESDENDARGGGGDDPSSGAAPGTSHRPKEDEQGGVRIRSRQPRTDSLETSLAGPYPSMPRQDSRLSLPPSQDRRNPVRYDSPVPPLPPSSAVGVRWSRTTRGGDGGSTASTSAASRSVGASAGRRTGEEGRTPRPRRGWRWSGRRRPRCVAPCPPVRAAVKR